MAPTSAPSSSTTKSWCTFSSSTRWTTSRAGASSPTVKTAGVMISSTPVGSGTSTDR
jgi:hypothetical protein